MGVKKIKGGGYRLFWIDENGYERKKILHSTKEDAESYLRDVKVRVDRIKAGLEVRDQNPDGMTLKEAAQKWLEGHDERDESTVKIHIIDTELGKLRLEKVTPARIVEHLDTLRPAPPKRANQKPKKELAPQTVNHVRKHLRAIFKAAISRGWFVGANPLDQVPKKQVKRRTLVTLTVDEASRLLAAASWPWRGILAAGLLGLRKGEIFGLDVDDVDTTRWEIHVHRSHEGATTKSGRARIVPIHPALRPVIAHAIELADAKTRVLFPGRKGARRHAGAQMARELNAYLKDAKIAKRIRFHDLRHTAATMMLQAGAPIQHVSKMLGHSSISITVDTYGHLVTDDVHAAIERVPLKLPT